MNVTKEVAELFEQYRKTIDATITKMPDIITQFQEGFSIMQKLIKAGFIVERETVASKEVTETRANGEVIRGKEQKVILYLNPLGKTRKESIMQLEATIKIYPEIKKTELAPLNTEITDYDREFFRDKIKL